MIGIALVGAGNAGRIQLTGWTQVPNARVVGVWNRSPERAAALASEFGVPHFADLDTLIAHPDVTAVDIASAMETHADYAARAARAGKHVLCQKPLAPTLPEAAGIVATCREAGVRLMVNENWRWRAWYRATKAALDDGAIGTPFYLRLAFRQSAAVTTPGRPPERLFARQPFLRTMTPLVLLELGLHHLDTTRFLFGTPADLTARTLKVTPPAHVAGEEVASVLLGYPDRIAQVEVSWASLGYPEYPEGAAHPDTLAVEGTEGTLFVGPDGQVRVARRDGSTERVAVDTDDAYQRSWTAALAHFARCLEDDTPFETPGEDYLVSMGLVFAAYESAAARQTVTIPPPTTAQVRTKAQSNHRGTKDTKTGHREMPL